MLDGASGVPDVAGSNVLKTVDTMTEYRSLSMGWALCLSRSVACWVTSPRTWPTLAATWPFLALLIVAIPGAVDRGRRRGHDLRRHRAASGAAAPTRVAERYRASARATLTPFCSCGTTPPSSCCPLARVEQHALRRVMSGEDPEKETRLLRTTRRRVPGFYLAFRAPKSVSLV